ncbi:hypothetical protein OPU71_20415 [Niveibacterium sp. 24ML]|uniref:hypothetical protein n=1 Tax=Niveibacterium sp. 24ML TaxID=2985512 RepID=UPI00226E0596|nr:hypothetical protein [Niveibacterium sp. 24ML]MCX9158493.1 hypothetical protein [Niveibacterium sp. 24ML]
MNTSCSSFVRTTLVAFSFLLSATLAQANPIIFTGDWYQSGGFGVWPVGTGGAYSEDHRFGFSSITSDQITDTDKMPGAFIGAATAYQQNGLTERSQVHVEIEFSRPFTVTKRAQIGIVDTMLASFFIGDDDGYAWVSARAGIDSAVLISRQAVDLRGEGTLTMDDSRRTSIVLDPGNYLLWGLLAFGASMDADLLVGADDFAQTNAAYTVNLVPLPNTITLLAFAFPCLVFRYRKKQSSPRNRDSTEI